MGRKRNLVIFYESYYPAYKAGGPVQSIINLCQTLKDYINIFVVCSAFEIDGTLLENIELNKWNEIGGVKIFYLTKKQRSLTSLKEIIDPIKPDLFQINGMFSLPFAISPLLLWHRVYHKTVGLILSPRGMLQKSALNQKSLKKSIFLSLFKILRLHRGVKWHATGKQEADEIKEVFGNGSHIDIIPNIPKRPFTEIRKSHKNKNSLRLVFISLITEMKNLTFALQCFKGLDIPVSFDIYGPIKNPDYWEECKKEIETMQPNITVKYLGDVVPTKVQDVFTEYDAFFLPTKGENFGHAIYESLSVGRPVIISNNTPWKGLEEKKAGFDIALDDKEAFRNAIHTLYAMDKKEYDEWCSGAMSVATDFYSQHDFVSDYLNLFK